MSRIRRKGLRPRHHHSSTVQPSPHNSHFLLLALRLTWDGRYTQKCSNLLTQYKAILKDAEVQERFGDLEQFQKQYNVQFTSATYRLKVGVPATVEHAGSHHHIPSTSESPTDQVNARHIAETVEVTPTTHTPFTSVSFVGEANE